MLPTTFSHLYFPLTYAADFLHFREDWHLIYRAEAGTGLSIYDNWSNSSYSNELENTLSDVITGCWSFSAPASCGTHYRSKVIDEWGTSNVRQVGEDVFFLFGTITITFFFVFFFFFFSSFSYSSSFTVNLLCSFFSCFCFFAFFFFFLLCCFLFIVGPLRLRWVKGVYVFRWNLPPALFVRMTGVFCVPLR